MDTKTTQETFAWPVRVYYEDTDAQGLVYYANYFKFMERARTEWLRSLGVELDVMARDQHRIFVVVGAEADFLEAARFNDELVVTASLGKLTRASFVIAQNIFRQSTDGALLCRGTIRAAMLDTQSLKPVRVPASLFEGSAS